MIKKIGSLLIFLGFAALLALAIAGPLYRMDIASLGFAFMVLRWAAYIGGAVVVLSVVYLIWQRPTGGRLGLVVASTIAAFIAFYLPYSQYQTATSVPPIHDITTDIDNPPEFVAIAPLRANAPNPVEYAGAETAEQQRQAYPDLTTFVSDMPFEEVYNKALQVVRDNGWQLVKADQNSGRIEATDTTTWFGFKDDVVIRIERVAGNTHVDVRSKSRVGRSDVGKNAERIRGFLNDLQQP